MQRARVQGALQGAERNFESLSWADSNSDSLRFQFSNLCGMLQVLQALLCACEQGSSCRDGRALVAGVI